MPNSSSLGVMVLAAGLALAPVNSALAGPAEGEAAAEASSPDDFSAQAVEAFEAKDYERAVEYFQKAYDADPNPNYLFNIGRVHEEAGNLRDAVTQYEAFVKSPGVDLESRKFANERLEVLRGIIRAEDEAKADEERRKKEAEGAAETGTTPDPAGDPAGATDTGPQEDTTKKARTAGFVLLGVGAGALIGGGVAGGLALGRHNDFEDETDPAAAADLQNSGKTLSLTADILYIGGGVLAATGIALVAASLVKKKRNETAHTVVAPTFGRTGAGLSLTHRF